jgi:preprotein translocase subunit YajC
MIRLKTIVLATAALGLAVAAAPVSAQAQAEAGSGLTAGMTIKDTAGGEVGTITAVDGEFVVVKTDKHEARLPSASFRAHEGAALFGMTRDQLNAAIDQQLGSAAQKIVAGASVTGTGGANIGTIEAVDAEWVTVKLTSGKAVRLPRKAVAPGPNGAVVGVTAAELEAAAAQAAAAAQ